MPGAILLRDGLGEAGSARMPTFPMRTPVARPQALVLPLLLD